MKAEFWQQRWKNNEIGFHEPEANPRLIAHWPTLDIPADGRVLVPLCGKTLDIGWFLSQGYQVVGAELSELAIQQLFSELGITPEITELEAFRLYQAENLDIYVGDIFRLTAEQLGNVDGIYDRGALIALPDDLRPRYTQHLIALTQAAPQLVITLQYDTRLLQGPPFHISHEEIQRHYTEHYVPTLLEDCEQPGGLKGVCDAQINVWALRSKT